ncbi:MAG: hypothetical protein RRY40_02730 [Oscillospiraceae bacterium]
MSVGAIGGNASLIYNKNLNSYVPASKKVSSPSTSKPAEKDENSISSLTEKQKEVKTAKKEFVDKTLSDGKTLTSVKSEIKAYDKQLSAIGEKLSAAFAKQQESAANTKPHELYSQNGFNFLSAISSSPQNMKIVTAMQSRLQSQSNVLKSEMKTDSLFRSDSKGNTSKEKELEKLSSRTDKIQNAIDTYKKNQEIGVENLNFEGFKSMDSNQQQYAVLMNA